MAIFNFLKKKEIDSKFVGRYQQSCLVKKILGENIPTMEMQIAFNKDSSERRHFMKEFQELERYISSDLFGSIEVFKLVDVQITWDSVNNITKVGYDTCILQNDEGLETRVLTILFNLSQYIKKIVTEKDETPNDDFRETVDDVMNSAVALGAVKYLNLGGLLQTEEEQMVWKIINSLDHPNKSFGHFDKSNLINFSLTITPVEEKENMAKKIQAMSERLVKNHTINENDKNRVYEMTKKRENL